MKRRSSNTVPTLILLIACTGVIAHNVIRAHHDDDDATSVVQPRVFTPPDVGVTRRSIDEIDQPAARAW